MVYDAHETILSTNLYLKTCQGTTGYPPAFMVKGHPFQDTPSTFSKRSLCSYFSPAASVSASLPSPVSGAAFPYPIPMSPHHVFDQRRRVQLTIVIREELVQLPVFLPESGDPLFHDLICKIQHFQSLSGAELHFQMILTAHIPALHSYTGYLLSTNHRHASGESS